MKRIIISVTVLCWILNASGQQTVTVTKKFEQSNQIEEQYSVLKSDETIWHGLYLKFFPATEEEFKELRKVNSDFTAYFMVKGNYINGKREGEWIFYDTIGVIGTCGTFTNDKESGIWTTTKEGGDVTERYDHDNGVKLPPRISLHVRYPPAAKKAKIEGVVSVGYNIHPDCSITDIAIVKSLSPACDSMMLSAITNYALLYQRYSFDCEEETETKDFQFRLEKK